MDFLQTIFVLQLEGLLGWQNIALRLVLLHSE